MHIQPVDATLGAIISDVKLAHVTAAQFAQIEDAFHEHAVLVFPAQGLTDPQQIAFARRFGEIEQLVADRDIVPISNQRRDGTLLQEHEHGMQIMLGNEGWHTDSSYMRVSAKASVLSAHTVPRHGGQTEWADMRAAHDALLPQTQAKLQDLSAFHSLYFSQAKIGHVVDAGAGYGFHDDTVPRRPLLKIHPVTGRPALYIGRHAYGVGRTDGSENLSETESQLLLDELVSAACQPPRTYMHSWQPGDVAIWDNRCVLHRARPYDHGEPRVMKHTRVAGDQATESCLT
jgi:alpha-ketoglutarate-dependent taurine dioxygenase